jgi:PAS domain S-box-containing protein
LTHIEIDRPLLNFFENSSIALALAEVGEDHNLLLVNERFSELTGYSADDVVGRNCRLLQTSSDGRQADNLEAKAKIRQFLSGDGASVRTPIVNFRKDGKPFVNLLFMSRLTTSGGATRYIFASQFDISRSSPHLLDQYDQELEGALSRIRPLLEGHNVMLEGTLSTIANSTNAIAQAKVTLAELDRNPTH